MDDITTIGLSKELKGRIDILAAKETLKRGKKIGPTEMVEILVKEKEEKKS